MANILGYANYRKAIIDHIDEDDKGVVKHDTLGGTQNLTIINESGLYSLMLSGKDVARILGYRETAKAIRDHIDEEDKGVSILDTPGGTQNMTIINESGLYSLILSSKDVASVMGELQCKQGSF